ncbi:GNAT family N-acetyltransferase [Chitinimonas sp.]|uniref:GNAT family N-acetyltransferase n=1 Tax=Chitinimonas sp. TaxID=1934313 RepID=UPI002F94E564
MKLTVQLRPMSVTDAKAVAELLSEQGPVLTVDDIAERFSRLATTQEQLVCVAELEGWIVGLCQVHGIRAIAGESHAEISTLAVAGGFQRRGIGRQLVERAQDWALAAGYPLLRLGDKASRTEAHRFFEAIGFVRGEACYPFVRQVLGGLATP